MAGTPKDPKRQKALNDSYSKATRWLIEQHQDEFNRRRATILKDEHDIDWRPPLTQEEKDERTLMDIIARSPSLLEKVTDGPNVSAPRQGAGEPKVDPHS